METPDELVAEVVTSAANPLVDTRHPAGIRRASRRLQLVAGPIDDGVTALRAEIKFSLRGADPGKLRAIFAVNCRRLVYNRPVSQVNSIYYDDHWLSAARENQNGADRRTKLRLRWYDTPAPATRVFLEVKRRVGKMIAKDRLAIHCRIPLAELTYDEIRAELCDILPPRYRELLMLRPIPVLVNSYRREHFAVPGSLTRVTLDYDIVSYAQAGWARPQRRFGVPLSDLIVIEGKAPAGHETELPRILFPLSPRVTRCSKYVQGCQALGFPTASAGIDDD